MDSIPRETGEITIRDAGSLNPQLSEWLAQLADVDNTRARKMRSL